VKGVLTKVRGAAISMFVDPSLFLIQHVMCGWELTTHQPLSLPRVDFLYDV